MSDNGQPPDQGAGIILDRPEQIEAYRILATYHGLRMEIGTQGRGWPPTACPTRGRALGSARRILGTYGVAGPTRTRKQCLASMEGLVKALGLHSENS